MLTFPPYMQAALRQVTLRKSDQEKFRLNPHMEVSPFRMGWYQWRMWAILSPAWFVVLFHVVNSVFYLRPSPDGTILEENTIAHRFPHLTTRQLTTTDMALYIGWMVGATVWSMLSDRLGRKPMYLSTWVVMATGTLIHSLAPSVPIYVAGKAVTGFGIGGTGLICFVWAQESLPDYLQNANGTYFNMWWSAGGLLLAGLAKLFPFYRTFQLVLAGMTLFSAAIAVPFVYESPRWLYTKGRTLAAVEVLEKMAAVNGTTLAVRQDYMAVSDSLRAPSRQGSDTSLGSLDGSLGFHTGSPAGSPAGLPAGSLEASGEAIRLHTFAEPADAADAADARDTSADTQLPPDLSPDRGATAVPLGGPSGSPDLDASAGKGDAVRASLLDGADLQKGRAAGRLEGGKGAAADASFFQTLTKPRNLVLVGLLMYIWFANAFVFYGLTLNAANIGSPFLNMSLYSVFGLPAQLLAFFLAEKWGARKALVAGMLAGGVSFAPLLFLDLKAHKIAPMLMSFSGQFAITMTYNLVYVITGKAFETRIRNSAAGICTTTSKIGSTCAPLITMLPIKMSMSIMGVAAFVGGVFSFFLPARLDEQSSDDTESDRDGQ